MQVIEIHSSISLFKSITFCVLQFSYYIFFNQNNPSVQAIHNLNTFFPKETQKENFKFSVKFNYKILKNLN